MSSSTPEPIQNPGSKPRRLWWMVLVASAAICAGTWVPNWLLIQHPVGEKLAADPRNNGFHLSAHYRYYVDPGTLVLDLRSADAVAPVDLCRGLFQSAEALDSVGRSFGRVILALSGHPVFIMTGDDFREIGRR